MSNRSRSAPSGPDAIRRQNTTISATTINSYTTGTVTFAFSGAATTDIVAASPTGAQTAGLGIVGCQVSAAGVVTLTVMNATAAAANTGTLNVNVALIRFSG